MSLTPETLLQIAAECEKLAPLITGAPGKLAQQLREVCLDTAITIRRLEQEIELLKHGNRT